jgi:nucleotide-binding universal stress UspA family protein
MQSKQILVPLDGSPLAEFALDEVRDIAELTDSRVTLLHVVPTIEEVIYGGGEIFTVDEEWERKKGCALDYLKSISDRPEWQRVKHSIAVEMGNPAEVILDFAQRQNIERIVMTTHGRTGITRWRWSFGSVATKVLQAADRTVVLVRAGVSEKHDPASKAQHDSKRSDDISFKAVLTTSGL